MSILNRENDGLLSVLIALRRGILAYGAMAETDLLALVAPSTVVPEGKAEQARQTLRRWTQLGFFEERDGRIAMSVAAQRIPEEERNLLRAEVLRLVLLPENNQKLLADDSEDQELSGASDCTRAMAWALAQDPYSFPSGFKSGAEALQNNQGIQPRPIQNDTRWPAFLEWADFLGILTRGTRNTVILNPWQAIKAVLPELFGAAQSLPQTDFLERLATLIPVFDGGSYRTAVDTATPRPWRDGGEREFSLTLSLSLLTLEVEGILRLEYLSDGLSCRLLGRAGREIRPVTHLHYLRGEEV
jgi:hypothetical protein